MNTRVVFDTNILISALLSLTGAPFRCLALAHAGDVQSVTCDAILNEFADKLRNKFAFDEEHVNQALHEVKNCSEIVTVADVRQIIPADPDDDVVIECALAGAASIVVSGDKHLRALGHFETVRILSANEFLQLLTQSG